MRPLHLALVFLAAAGSIPSRADLPPTPGLYFAKKTYTPAPLPTFAEVKDKLPSPILDSRPELVAMYWKCWELCFQHLKQPAPGSPFVSNRLDAAFNGDLFQWDTIFMLMFARYANAEFPAIQSLDNFYCSQRKEGFICREFRPNGGEVMYMGPVDAVNPPLFSWAEVESFRLTGDKSRFAMVLPPLEKYVAWLNSEGDPAHYETADWIKHGHRAANSVHQLYWNTPLGSGMDNSPRGGNGWVDMSCQMVMQYNDLAVMADELGLTEKASSFRVQAQAISARINRWCWNENDGFYYDVQNDGTQFKIKTSGGFWPMIAGITSKAQSDRLVAHLKNEKEFWRPFIFPTLAADEKEYENNGGYWHGSVWAPTNFEIIKGLEKGGYEDFATQATNKYLTAMAAVLKDTGTVWENYAPELPLHPGSPAARDFVGWSGDGPIALLIENVLGFRCDGSRHQLTWRLSRTDRHGMEKLQFGGVTTTLICDTRHNVDEPAHVTGVSNQPFTLIVILGSKTKRIKISSGPIELTVP